MVDDGKPTDHPPRDSWERMLARKPELARTSLRQVYEHATETYPNECCGFIRASGQVHCAVNDQDILHAEDPVRWPRTARAAYSLAAPDLYLLALSFFSSDPAIVVYHSHPDVGAYFSEKDATDAMYDGKPIYEVDYLVIDVRQAGAKGAKLFRFMNPGFACVWREEI